jgi:CBS domain containing-hemolysin-like protein
MTSDLLLLLFLLVLSAFFSSSEIAFIVANKIKVELRARKNNLYAVNARYFLRQPDKFFSTILIANNVVNIAFASLSSVFLLKIFGLNDFEILLVSTSLILIFGELIPKFIGRELADRLVLFSALPLRLINVVIYPFAKVTSLVSSVLTRTNLQHENELLQVFDKEDIQNLIDESTEAGKVDAEQSDIINRVIDIREKKVYEAMTPRTAIVGVDVTSTIVEVLDKFIESGYSKLVVYEDNLDNIKGLVITKDIFQNPLDLKSVLRQVEFVPETKKCLDMLNEFLERKFSFAVVVDEFGGTAGILTIEDIIEELFGEIRDEYDDVNEKVAKKLDANSFLLNGKVEIDYLNEEFELKIPEGDYATIAGYILLKLGRIPMRGESFKIDNNRIQILKSDKTKIDLLKLTVEQELQD